MSRGEVEYSPLCDTDRSAYYAYLLANVSARSERDGKCYERAGQGHGSGGESGCVCGSFDVRKCAGGAVLAKLISAWTGTVVDVSGCGVAVGRDDFVGRCIEGCGKSGVGVARVSSDNAGDGGGCVFDKHVYVDETDVGCGDAKNRNDSVGPVEVCSGLENGGAVCVERGGVTSDVGLGKNTLRNREWRKERKERKKKKQEAWKKGGDMSWRKNRVSSSRGYFSTLGDDVQQQLKESRAERLKVENELKRAEACQRLELVKAQDMEQLKKKQQTRLMRDTEVNKVQIEQAFGTLAMSGNVPGVGGSVPGGRVQTVVSDGSTPGLTKGSISPSSSISEKEVRDLQRDHLALEKKYQEMERVFKLMDPKSYAHFVDYTNEKAGTEQTGFSLDENGVPYCDMGDHYAGFIGKDGRLHEHDPHEFDEDRW